MPVRVTFKPLSGVIYDDSLREFVGWGAHPGPSCFGGPSLGPCVGGAPRQLIFRGPCLGPLFWALRGGRTPAPYVWGPCLGPLFGALRAVRMGPCLTSRGPQNT